MKYLYQKAVLGGTFDHFHLGHQKFLDTAFEESHQVTIGLAQPVIFHKKFLSNVIESYQIREKNLRQYLANKQYLDRAVIIPIDNIFGNTLTEENIDAIFATVDTEHNVDVINNKRNEIGFDVLKKIIVPFVKSADGNILSSERIRKGEIDTQGFVYKSLFEQKQTFVLPDDLRQELKHPLGRLVENTNDVLKIIKDQTVIAVGDVIVSSLKKEGFTPALSIIDFRTRREDLPQLDINGIKTTNKQGTINSKAALALQKALHIYLQSNQPQTVIVDGEEDLLAVPAILFAPLDAIVLYGQFDQGVVINNSTETKKQVIVQLLNRFN
jgi:cytidyltransferase-like protein